MAGMRLMGGWWLLIIPENFCSPALPLDQLFETALCVWHGGRARGRRVN